jgi:hypothetical protein
MATPVVALATNTSPRIERCWAMPKKDVTRIPIINQLLVEEMADDDFWLTDLFETESGRYAPNRLVEQRIDTYERTRSMLPILDGLLFNPPITFAQAAAYHRAVGYRWDGRSSWWSGMKDKAADLIRAGGKAICISWDSTGLGISRGFIMERLLIVNHGGHWHDSIVTVERKGGF